MPQVLGVKLFERDIPAAVSDFMLDIKLSPEKSNKLVSATGVHGLVTAQLDKEFKSILNAFYCNLPDGMPGVWIGRSKGFKSMKRCPGPDFFEAFLSESSNAPIKHFFCGGKEGVADELKKAVSAKFNNNKIVGTFCPPFRQMSETEYCDLGNLINESGADVVWLGLSSPKQERFAFKLKRYTEVNFIITVGAAFDFHTDKIKKAPKWMQSSGLEWSFRLMSEPKRLYKRYFTIIPLFVYYNFKELLQSIKLN